MSRRSVQGKVSPKGWREVKLKQNESQRSIRVNPSTKKLKDFLRAPVKNGFSPICVSQPTSKKVLGLGALTGSGLKLDETKWVSESNTEVDKFLIKRGDFLVSRSNTLDKVGRAAFYEGRLKNISYPDLMMKFRVDEKKIDPRFLELILQSYHARKHFMRHASGTSGSMVKITKSVVESLEVPLFSLGMQRSIVNLVFTWKEAIEKTERLIAAKEKRFRWVLLWLINKAGHHEKEVSDFTIEVSTRNREDAIERVLSVTNHSGFILPEDQFERRVASANLSNYKIVNRGEYAYNPSRINVGSITRLDDWEIGVLSPMYVVFKLNETKINSDYFLHWLSSYEAKQRIKNSTQGSVRETVSFEDFGAILIPLPSMEKQREIAGKLNTVKHEIVLLQQLAEKYRTQKRGLTQKLLIGEWKVQA